MKNISDINLRGGTLPKILVVEDEPVYREIIVSIVQRLGYEVVSSGSAEEALELIKQSFYPIILLDILLPKMKGTDLSRIIRQMPNSELYFIIATTSQDQKENITEILSAGIDDYITKPVNFKQLMIRLTIAENYVNNIQEKKKAEVQFKDSEEKYRLLFENARDAILLEDPETRLIINCNKAAEVLLKTTKKTLIGRHHKAIHPPQKADEYDDYIKKTIKENGVIDREVEIISSSGELRRAILSGTLYHSLKKKALQLILHDITERKQLEEQIVQAEKMKVVATLATGVAHEVKNPLAIICQGIDYLNRKIKTDNEDILTTLHDIEHAVNRADTIVRGILDFSSLSDLEIKTVNPNKIITKALALLNHNFKRANISIGTDLQKDIPPIRIDKNKIEQVLLNLLMNAIDAMPDGGKITVKAYSDIMELNREYVIIEIKDTGQGIPDELLAKIFDPFFTTKRNTGGTGLGLSIVKNIIEMHHGAIDITNASDQGTIVYMRFETDNKE